MEHSYPTFLLSDYCFFFHYSEKINTFFFKLVNIYVLPPGQGNQHYYEKEKFEVSAETTNKKKYILTFLQLISL